MAIHRNDLTPNWRAVAVCCCLLGSAIGSAAFAVEPATGPSGGKRAGIQLAPGEGGAVTAPGPVTFGVTFRPGEIPRGKTVKARLGDADVPAQLDAKRRYEDGSLKHGVLTVMAPKLEAPATLSLSPADPPSDSPGAREMARKLLASDFEAAVSFRFPEGKPVSASARKMLEAAGEKAATWLAGPLAVEWLLSGPPTGADGQADPDLNVQFQVRYYPTAGVTRVSAVVEKCSDSGCDGGLVYDVSFTRGRAKPEVVFQQKDVRHPDLTRYRKVFYVGKEPPEVGVRHDALAMAAAGVIPQYDFSLKVDPTVADGLVKHWQTAKKGLFENGLITPYMPMTGGRADLGVLPTWTVVYLHTMDARVKQAMLDNDDLSGGIPIHARLRETGRVPFYKGQEMLWLADDRAGRWGTERWRPKPDPVRTTEPVKSIFSPDPAHLPSLCYVPYVVTGDYYHLEENWFWATYVLFSNNPGYAKGMIIGQLRGMAWSLRTAALTAAISPDDTPETAEFSERTRASLKYFLKLLDEKTMPLGMLAPHGGGGKINYAPWQHDYMIMAVDAAANAGFKDAETLRTRLLEFSMGRFTHGPDFDPHYGCGYWWDVGNSTDGVSVKTWKDLFEVNCAGKKASWADYPGGYCGLAVAAAAIGVRTGYPDARQVYDWLKENTRNVLPGQSKEPTFAYSTVPIR